MEPSNPHRLAEERSLALHREVARRLRERPELVDEARARVQQWLRDGSTARPYAEAWAEILTGEIDEVVAAIVDAGPRARQLRQCSPFAGVVDPRTRWRILDEVRQGGAQ